MKWDEELIYYARTREWDNQKQLLLEHLQNVARDTKKFAEIFGVGEIGEFIGIIHDIGKYSSEFQEKLNGVNNGAPHSAAGAKWLQEQEHFMAPLFTYILAGHHGGLQDYGSLNESGLQQKIRKFNLDFCAYKDELDIEPFLARVCYPSLKTTPGSTLLISFFIRMLFSCLVDADYLDAEDFNTPGGSPRTDGESMAILAERCNRYMDKYAHPVKQLDKQRNLIRFSMLEKVNYRPGVFTCSVPTGGGKNFATTQFALQHAVANRMRRVIQIVPYTSIIEQNAEEIRKILGNTAVLEHHSNYFEGEDTSEDDEKHRLRLASENWDLPVVFSTNVQFFESLFAARTSSCRKLHNIAQSVIVLDEAQMLDVDYLRPCVAVLEELVKNYGCSVVLCSATVPPLEQYFSSDINLVELASREAALSPVFERTKVTWIGGRTDAELAENMAGQEQVLCIVNTRKHARMLFNLLPQKGRYHLSTMMYPAHRKRVITEIKQRLKDGKIVRLVSTQLIECGVDLDFPVVLRSLAGIDSIIQSAGRCNREGQGENGQVYIFESLEAHAKVRGYLDLTGQIGKTVLSKYADNPIQEDAVRDYFTELYHLEGELDRKGILARIDRETRSRRINFKTIEREFKLIDDTDSYNIYILCDESGQKLLGGLRYKRKLSRLDFRALAPYSISLRKYELKDHMRALEAIGSAIYVLTDPSYYSDETGIAVEEPQGEAIFV